VERNCKRNKTNIMHVQKLHINKITKVKNYSKQKCWRFIKNWRYNAVVRLLLLTRARDDRTKPRPHVTPDSAHSVSVRSRATQGSTETYEVAKWLRRHLGKRRQWTHCWRWRRKIRVFRNGIPESCSPPDVNRHVCWAYVPETVQQHLLLASISKLQSMRSSVWLAGWQTEKFVPKNRLDGRYRYLWASSSSSSSSP